MPDSLLSDELLRSLIAAGHVDVLVGIPTFNNAATIESLARAVEAAFSGTFARERTLLLNVDGGSDDGTPELVRRAAGASTETVTTPQELRTRHRISAPYHGIPGKANALRLLFTVAELTQARAVAVLDADYGGMTPASIAALVRPALRDGYDFVSPVYPRAPLEAPLVSQLVRPLMSATYERRMREPVTGDFACSSTFAARCAALEVWDTDLARDGIDVWLTATAMADSFRLCEAAAGPRVQARRPSLGVAEVFSQVVGALFECLELHAASWLQRSGMEPVPRFGEVGTPERAPLPDPEAFAGAFRAGSRDLRPVHAQMFSPGLHARLLAAAEEPAPGLEDDLWVETVIEGLAGYHHAVLGRRHLVQALVPIYLGRVAGLARGFSGADGSDADEGGFTALEQRFEGARPLLLERWNAAQGR